MNVLALTLESIFLVIVEEERFSVFVGGNHNGAGRGYFHYPWDVAFEETFDPFRVVNSGHQTSGRGHRFPSDREICFSQLNLSVSFDNVKWKCDCTGDRSSYCPSDKAES